MKDLFEFENGGAVLVYLNGSEYAAKLILNAEEIMLDAMRLLSTAKAGQDANELAARMNGWCEAWNE